MGLPESKAILLKKFVGFHCEICGNKKKASDLHPHRINRGYLSGAYVLRNIMIICTSCHSKIHFKEFNG
jgi:5-methylcytosine-specific restriction endonuclease McrA